MIDHLTIDVTDFARSKKFYLKALEPLGYEIMYDMSRDKMIGLGVKGETSLWIIQKTKKRPSLHVAFRASTRSTVKKFYEAGLKVGGRDHGAPGLRPDTAKPISRPICSILTAIISKRSVSAKNNQAAICVSASPRLIV